MSRFASLGVLTLLTAGVCGPVFGQTTTTTTTGSVGCAAITQAASNGVTSRVQADDTTINPPTSVTNLTCLDNFFNGVGLNLVTNLINPSSLLQVVEGKICSLVRQEWNSLLGSAQCGLTVTGFNIGFGGIGGGPPIGSVGIGTTSTSGGGLYINGNGMVPTGYNDPGVAHGSF